MKPTNMKASAFKYAMLSLAAILAMVILALVPLHALLTVWLSSLIGHYTIVRLWKETLLFIIALAAFYLLLADEKIRTHTLTRRLVWLIIAYSGLQLLLGAIAYGQGRVTGKALAYGWLIDLRTVGFCLLTWAIALRTSRLKNWEVRLLLAPAAVVVVFGLFQIFVLPPDFLKHFGYGPATIKPIETINNNSQYIRIASTLRGANPLGAYLIIPLTMLSVLLVRGTARVGRPRLAVFWLATAVVLTFSFSRSAWIGAALSQLIVLALCLRAGRARQYLAYGAIVVVLIGGAAAVGLQHSSRFQNLIFHTQTSPVNDTSSNEGHLSALRGGWHDLVHQPLGRGPGTAGPASVYNGSYGIRLAENYYIQLVQEVGLPGLLLFLLINAGIGYLLWLRRSEPLAMALLASLVGLTVVNMLSHAWADDTLAYVWWGLAGIVLARLPVVLPEAQLEPAAPSAKPRAKNHAG